MTRILLVYYSNSGDAARVAEALAASLRPAGIELVVERLRPTVNYPNPWRSIRRFFSILPECHLGPLPELEQPGFDPDARFDLVILVYQVWFLVPSLPVQAFLNSPCARVLRDTRVMTVSVSRNMWQSASEAMKTLLRQVGAHHIDNIVLTHQGPAWATFVTTPRSLLFGRKDRFWGIFPPAGLGDSELARVERLGRAIAAQADKLHEPQAGSLLRGLGAVQVNRRYLLPELVGWYWFRTWARVLHRLGRSGSWPRTAGTYLFVVCLCAGIVVGIPIIIIVRFLLAPFMRNRLDAYARRLAQPSEDQQTPSVFEPRMEHG